MSKMNQYGFARLLNATRYSWQGLRATYLNEQAFRQEAWLLAVAVPLALWLGETGLEKALLIGSILLILIVELLNSAIEATVDRIGDERHQLSGRAKDMGSAAVMLTIANAALLWVFVIF